LLANDYLKSKRAAIENEGPSLEEPKLKLEYAFSDLWDHFILDLDGQPIANKKRSADFGELGEISQKEMSKILTEVFGSKRKKTTAGNKAIVFNPEKIMRLGTVYDVTSTVKVGEEVTNLTSGVFSDYLTNLTNLVKDRVEEMGKEAEETLENYG
jgi:hypothetical protein